MLFDCVSGMKKGERTGLSFIPRTSSLKVLVLQEKTEVCNGKIFLECCGFHTKDVLSFYHQSPIASVYSSNKIIMLHAVPFRQKVQINKSTADMASKKVTEESVSTLGRAGVGQKGERRSGEASVVRHWSKALVILPQYSPHPIFPIKYFSRLAQHWQNSSNFTQSIGCFILFVPCVPH